LLISSRCGGEGIESLAGPLRDFCGIGFDTLGDLFRIERLTILAELFEQRCALSEKLGESLMPRLARCCESLGIREIGAVPRETGARQGEANGIADGQPTGGDSFDDGGAKLAKLYQR